MQLLTGFTVGITADRRWEEQASLFERRGASVVHGPTIRTRAVGNEALLRAATAEVIARRPAVLIANTGLGIRSWFNAAESWGLGEELADALRHGRIVARGPKAAGAVHSYDLEVEARASSERLRDAVDLALEATRPGDVVALQLDGRGTSTEAARLEAAGVRVLEVPIYSWELPEDPAPAVRLAEAVVGGRVQAVTFTAGPAIRNWLAIAAAHGLEPDLRAALSGGGVVVGCVGPVCADTLATCGLAGGAVVVPGTSRLGPLVRTVGHALEDRRLRFTVGRADVVLAGTAAIVDGDEVALTDTEAQVLTVLAARANQVVAKADLLRLVWHDEEADPHLVEVVVGRLRRRLGPVGAAVASVYRRGYVLRCGPARAPVGPPDDRG